MLDEISFWAWLPTGVLHLIFSHTGAWNLRRVRQVCKNWRGSANLATLRLTASPKHMFPPDLLGLHFPNITFLNLTCDWVNRGSLFPDVIAGLQIVSMLPRLASLSLSGWTDLKDEHAVMLPTMTGLQDLDLTFCSGLSDVGLVYISEMINLKSLVLASCSSMTDEGFPLLGKLIGLKRLVLSGTEVGNKGLLALKNLKELSVLELMECRHVGDLGIVVLLPSLRNLIELDLRECSDVSSHGLEIIISEKLEMKRLLLEGCERVTRDDIQRLESLTSMKINDCGPSLYSLDAGNNTDQDDFYSDHSIVDPDTGPMSSDTSSSCLSFGNAGEFSVGNKRLRTTQS